VHIGISVVAFTVVTFTLDRLVGRSVRLHYHCLLAIAVVCTVSEAVCDWLTTVSGLDGNWPPKYQWVKTGLVIICAATSLCIQGHPRVRRKNGRDVTFEAHASIWDRITFGWVSPLMKKCLSIGWLDEHDLWELPSMDRTTQLMLVFSRKR
jgi:hypothetical protein